jgi:uncharacterized integral membrane protein
MANDDDLPRERRQEPTSGGMNGVSPSLIGFGIVAVLAVIFFFQNGRRVEVNFWLFDWNTTVRWSLMVAMFMGVLLDRLLVLWWRHRAKRKNEAKQS